MFFNVSFITVVLFSFVFMVAYCHFIHCCLCIRLCLNDSAGMNLTLLYSSVNNRSCYFPFPGEPEVTLSEKCAGEVRINNISVCSSNWNLEYSHLICQEKSCSNAIVFDTKTPPPQSQSYHVTCEEYHDKLGQCNLFKGQCNGGLVSVYCVGMYAIF